MNAEKKGFKYRLSNVLAWLGFGAVVYATLYTILTLDWDGIDGMLAALAFQCFIGVINYLMIGSFRLLPWRDIE